MKRLFQRLFRSAPTRPFRSARRLPGLEQLEDRLVPAATLTIQDAPTGIFPQFNFVDPNPDAGRFGTSVVPLSTGNVVVTDPLDDASGMDSGAVYLFNGLTGELISTLTGSSANDQVGNAGVVALTNGNFVVRSQDWNNGDQTKVGAVTWGSGVTGVSGVVSAANSIIGSSPDDQVGRTGLTALPNGNFVIRSQTWNNVTTGAGGAGAVTWGDGTTGQSATGFGAVSDLNSIVGSSPNDAVGGTGLTVLTNGNFVIRSSIWTNAGVIAAGAATWGDGLTGRSATGFGAVSPSNSIVGTNTQDTVSGNDVVALSNGNFVVVAPGWDNPGVTGDVGAVTWGDGTTGASATGFGAVSPLNSIIGSTEDDRVGGQGVTALSNGNFVVASSAWTNATTAAGSAGAATWGNGVTGQSVTGCGFVSDLNSIVGTSAGDQVSREGVTALTNGNFVIANSFWDDGGATNAGAATWGNGATGQSATGFGAVSNANSIVGAASNDNIAQQGVTALTNGHFVVASRRWDNSGVSNTGAVTWGNGVTGQSATGFGAVTTSNSIFGTTNNESVASTGVVALSNGNFEIVSPEWTGLIGAATWGNGTTGQSATGFAAVSDLNSILGSAANNEVSRGGVRPLPNGNFVVLSHRWDNNGVDNVGAITWGDGATGQSATGFGTVSNLNSLVGGVLNDMVGSNSLTILSDGNFVAPSLSWDNGATTNVGAVSWGNGLTGATLDGAHVITGQNSIVGTSANASPTAATVRDDAANQAFVVGLPLDNGMGRVASAFTDPNLLTFARGGSQTIKVTPAFVADTLSRGTAVTLQATNTLEMRSPLTVNNAGGDGGDLTLQSQFGFTLNANIDTDNGDLLVQAPIMSTFTGRTLTTGAGTVTFDQGSFNVAPSFPSTLTVNGKLAFTSDLTYSLEYYGATPGDGYDQIIATGGVNLGNAVLNLDINTILFNPPVGQSATLIDNQSGTAVVGTFAGLPEGKVFLGDGVIFRITYQGNEGRDVVITRVAPPAAELVVDNTGDASDGDYSAGQLTLREAVELANLSPDANTITFDATVFGTPQTITLGGTQLPTITADLTILGPDTVPLTLDADGQSRHLTIATGVTADVMDLTLTGGLVSNANGGSIDNAGTLTLSRVRVIDNQASGDTAGFGGGISNDGTLTLTQSTVAGNAARIGGGINSFGTLTISFSTLTENKAASAGGVRMFGGAMNPSLRSSFDPNNNGPTRDLVVAGSVAYLGEDGLGLVTVDVSNPAAPTQLGSLPGIGLVSAVAVVANTVYAGNLAGVFHVIDVSDPSNPTLLGSLSGFSAVQKLSVVGTTAYLATDTGLEVIDVASPANPTLFSSLNLNTQARDIKMSGTLAYLVSSSVGLLVVDVSDPEAPALAGTYESPFSPVAVDVAGVTAFLVSLGGVEVLDVSNPANPTLIDTKDFSAFSVAVEGSTGYFGTLAGLRVVDVQFSSQVTGTITNDDSLVVDNIGDVDDGDYTAGKVTLREAINLANAFDGADTITFAAALNGQTITLGGTRLPDLGGQLTITGPGAKLLTIDAGGNSGVFFTAAVAELEISGLTVTRGRAGDEGGGALVIQSMADVNLRGVAFVGNSNNGGFGGAIYNFGSLTVSESLVANNHSEFDSGGIANRGQLTIVNSTLSGNVTATTGGGLADLAGQVLIRNSTIVNNRAGIQSGGIAHIQSGNLFYLYNSIVAGNLVGPEGNTTPSDFVSDTPFLIVSSHNVIADAATAGDQDDGFNGNIIGINNQGTRRLASIVDPVLRDNGGPTLTHALNLASSPARNNGANAQALDVMGAPLTTDQRGVGFPRFVGTVDMGAVEGVALASGPFLVDEAGDIDDGDYSVGHVTLREAIGLANAASGADVISFAAALNGQTITLNGEQLPVIASEMTISGPGADRLTIDGNGMYRVFQIAVGAKAEISGVTITRGLTTDKSGGGVFTRGELILRAVAVVNNTATSDSYGAGIYNEGALTLLDSLVANNTGGFDGAGLDSTGESATIINTTFSGNVTDFDGGAIGVYSGPVVIRNSTLVGNRAGTRGGGIYDSGFTTVTLFNTIVAGNVVGAEGSTTPGDLFSENNSGLAGSSHNIIGDAATSAGLTDGMDGNLVGVGGSGTRPLATIINPTLAENGGPTLTHALEDNSVALNAGDDALALDAEGDPLALDQRGAGFPRFVGTVDIGAFEVPAVASATLSPDPLDPGKMALIVEGDGNANTVRIQSKGGGRVEVVIDGESLGTFTPTGRIVVMGGMGDDVITVSGSKQPAWVYGGPGNDTLTTGAGKDVVVGGAGDDTLKGGKGRDILIGGTGRDTLKGQEGRDILVAGFTLYDNQTLVSEQALAALAAVWTGGGTFQERVQQVRDTGVGNGNSVRLNATTVGDDGVSDELRGRISDPQDVLDWFLADRDDQAPDSLLGVRPSDVVTDIDVLEG